MGNYYASLREIYDSGSSAKEESIINLSDHCIERITREDKTQAKQEKLQDVEESIQPTDFIKIEEDRWMKVLKCMDDVHTNTHELTIPAIYALMEQVENNIGKLRPQICSTDELMLCLKRHENCMIKCKKLMDEFIDCIDKSRIDIIKEKNERQNKYIQDTDNELAKEFMSVSEH